MRIVQERVRVASMSFPDRNAPREPAFSAPANVLLLIALLFAVHAIRVYLVEDDVTLILDYSFIPARLSLWLDPQAFTDHIREAVRALSREEGARTLALAAHLIREDTMRWWTLVTYAGLHGSWTHLIVNAVWLLAFATPVARRLGPAAAILLYFMTALGGALLHWGLHGYDVTPMVGASAIASGVMGAASRFMFQPIASPAFAGAVRQPPVQSLIDLARNRRAVLFILIWMASNALFGLLAQPLGISDGGIAWEAHIGGFVAGFLLMPMLEKMSGAASASSGRFS